MERYDNIEYSFEDTEPMPPDDRITTTDKDGFITSQQYIPDNAPEEDNMTESIPEPEPKRKRDPNSPRETVLVFQLVTCILIALAAFVIKSIGGELYDNVRSFYVDNLNNSIIIDTQNTNNYDFVDKTVSDDNK